MDGALPFHEAHHLGHRILGRNRNQQVDMIRLQMTFQNLALLLSGQVVKELPQRRSDPSIENLHPVHDRTGTRANFQTVPAVADPDILQPLSGLGIESRFEEA